MAVALMGPDPFLLYLRTMMPTLGVSLSLEGEQRLLLWAVGLHFVQDLPLLAINWLLHARLSLPWDATSLGVLGCSLANLTVHFAWHCFRLMRLPDADDDDPDFAPSLDVSPHPLKRQKTAKVIDSSQYVGFSNTKIIGISAEDAAYAC